LNLQTQRLSVAGPAGAIECALDIAGSADSRSAQRGVAVICHPHPQHGGTMDNKVVQTLARTFALLGYEAVRFNFRGVGASVGEWDEGRGEVDDALAVIGARRQPGRALVLAGFSFGAYVASQAAQRLDADDKPRRLVLVGPAVRNFAMAAVADDTLVIHGEADDVVPLAAVLDWARPQSLPIVVIPGVGHFFHGHLTQLKNLLLRNWQA